jgi:hypothetical protein
VKLVALSLVLSLLAGPSFARTNTTVAQKRPFESSVPADFMINLENIGGLSTLNYYVKIAADGTVEFGGRTFEVDITNVKSKITIEETKALVWAIERVNYFSLRDKYDDKKSGCAAVAFDAGSVITSVTMHGKSKHIIHYHGCYDKDGSVFPSELTALEKQIESIANVNMRSSGYIT